MSRSGHSFLSHHGSWEPVHWPILAAMSSAAINAEAAAHRRFCFRCAAHVHVDGVRAAAAIADVWLPPAVPWGYRGGRTVGCTVTLLMPCRGLRGCRFWQRPSRPWRLPWRVCRRAVRGTLQQERKQFKELTRVTQALIWAQGLSS